jgi:EAL domain-containing protein (putative c-di-GMP-specific phosphodiesterase class I)
MDRVQTARTGSSDLASRQTYGANAIAKLTFQLDHSVGAGQQALEDVGGLLDAGCDIVLATNLSAASIQNPFFVSDISKLIEETGFEPARLEFEITESVAMRDPQKVSDNIAGLRRLGIKLAIDDFGAGYSNLATMARLPFDTVKIDRSLVQELASDLEKQTIVRTALTLATDLGFETVVEGIETMEDFEFVANAGATYAQGYLFSTPVSIDELSILLQPARLATIAATVLNRHDADEHAFDIPSGRAVNF